MRSYNFKQD